MMAAAFAVYWAKRLAMRPDMPFPKSPLMPGMAVFVCLVAVSALGSEIPSKNLLEAYKLASAMLAFVACVVLFPDRRHLRALATVLSLTGGALALFGLLQYVGALPRTWWDRPYYLSSVYMNHNHFAGLLEATLPVSLALLLVDKDTGKKTLLLFLNGVMGVAFLLTMSRGGYAAMTAAAAVFGLLVLRGRGARRLGWILGSVGMLGLLLALFGVEAVGERLATVSSAEGLLSDMSWQQRLFVWDTALRIIAAHPFFGTGPGTFAFTFLSFQPEHFNWRPGYTHNDYLNLAADCGLPAALVLVVTLAYFTARVLRGLRTEESRTRTALGAAGLSTLAAYAVHALADFNFHIPANTLVFAVVLGMLNTVHTGEFYRQRRLNLALNAAVSALIAFVLVSGFVLGVAHFYFFKGDFSAALATDANFSAAYAERGKERALTDPRAAAGDFERARALNGYEPNFDLWYIECFRKTTHRGRPLELVPAYERMLAKQPASGVLRYLAGSRVLEENTARDPEAERWGRLRLAEAARLDPEGQAARVLDFLWSRDRNAPALMRFAEEAGIGPKPLLAFLERKDLWRYHRDAMVRYAGIRPNQRVWTGRVLDWESGPDDEIPLARLEAAPGADIYKDGVFYASGEVHTRVKIHKGESRLVIRASGTSAKGVFPYLAVKLDDRIVNTHYVDMRVSADYHSLIETEPGTRTLSLSFLNDAVDERTGQDRNIRIEKIQLQYPKEDA